MELFDAAKNFFLNLSGENYINLFSIIIVAVTTYWVTKYNVLKPNKLRIKEQQLDNIYLPLYKLFLKMSDNFSIEDAVKYYNELSKVLENNYLFAFPELHELKNSLGDAIKDNGNYIQILKRIKHQVGIDYELLKKALGYPSKNWYEIFIRMTFRQKVESILAWVNVLFIFIPVILMYPLAKYSSPYGLYIFVGLYAIICLVLNKLNIWSKKLKD